MMNTQATKLVALYSRLSRDDELAGQSSSITNQMDMLEKYSKDNGYTNIKHFSDDGYSGTRFDDRPGFTEMMSEVDAGNISIILTKDITRIGRDYLRVGLYMESFRQKCVRLIGISDGTDTANSDDDLMPFRNIIAEMYARDTSRKIKSVLQAKGRDGKRLTTAAIYGYRKSPDNKNQWIIDDEAAANVRRIFSMAIDGKGPYQIARALTDEKVMRPSAYIALRDGHEVPMPDDRYNWNGATVRKILDKPEYMGHTVNFRTYKDSYKDHNNKQRPREEWVVFENTHEYIVAPETWETAQRLRVVRRRNNSTGEANPLTGLTYCADCGSRMHNHRGTWADQYDSRDNYACNAYAKYPPKCTMHYIKTSTLRTLALDAIRAVSSFVREDEDKFVRLVREAHDIQNAEAAKVQRKQLLKCQKRSVELDTLIKRLYEDKVSGELTPKRFEILSGGYEVEQAELEQSIAKLQTELDRYTQNGDKTDKFIALVRRYTEFPELTATILNEFIQKIVVFEADKSSGQREQQVDVYFNFVGKFEMPRQDIEAKPCDPTEKRRARQRTYYRKNREKILARETEKRAAAKRAAQLTSEEEPRCEKKSA